MSDLLSQIDKANLPRHIAIIMDGNGRWAKSNGKPRIFGHRNGVKSVKRVTEVAADLGIDFLTMYAFSTENWNRPPAEVNALMHLLVETVKKELRTLKKNGIRLKAIGNIEALPKKTYDTLLEGIDMTKDNNKMTLTLALNYSSRWEITEAMKQIAEKVKQGKIAPEDVDEVLIAEHLTTHDIPDPELLIRTSGEHRISNYLLWQLAYTEFYFTDVFWPDFNENELHKAILDYQNRERRFGKISEQIKV